MSNLDDPFVSAGGDDAERLVPEWSRSADQQIVWLGLVVVVVLAVLVFGIGSLVGDDGILRDLAESVGLLGD